MVEWETEKTGGKTTLLVYATVFEKEKWSTGHIEILHTLFRISEEKKHFDEPTERRMREALKNSAMLKDKEIMQAIKEGRKDFNVPRFEWWWWPEKIK